MYRTQRHIVYVILIGFHEKGCNLIRNTRRDMYGDDKFWAIESKYGNGSKTDRFLMFSYYWCDEDGPQRIFRVCATIPSQAVVMQKLFLHVDATF